MDFQTWFLIFIGCLAFIALATYLVNCYRDSWGSKDTEGGEEVIQNFAFSNGLTLSYKEPIFHEQEAKQLFEIVLGRLKDGEKLECVFGDLILKSEGDMFNIPHRDKILFQEDGVFTAEVSEKPFMVRVLIPFANKGDSDSLGLPLNSAVSHEDFFEFMVKVYTTLEPKKCLLEVFETKINDLLLREEIDALGERPWINFGDEYFIDVYDATRTYRAVRSIEDWDKEFIVPRPRHNGISLNVGEVFLKELIDMEATLCKNPKTIFWEKFIEVEARKEFERDAEVELFVNEILEKKSIHDSKRISYNLLPLAPICDFASFQNFCLAVGVSNSFEQWEITNKLMLKVKPL